MDFAIKLSGVSKSFGAHRAVEGISLTVAPGELVGIVGPDGAGKTTLARLAAGVMAPTSGKVEPESRGRVGYLTGRFSLYPELTVRENLLFFAKIYGMSGAQAAEASERLLEWVQMLPFRNPFDGRHLRAAGLDAKDAAGVHHAAVEDNGAGATVAVVAALLRPREAELVAQDLEEALAWLAEEVDVFAVQASLDLDTRH